MSAPLLQPRAIVRAKLAELLGEPLERVANDTRLRKLSRYDVRAARRLLNEFGLDLPEEQLRRLERVQDLLQAIESAPRLGRLGSRVAGRDPEAATAAPETAVPPLPVETPPPLPLAPAPAGTFESSAPFEAERIGAVAVHCGDGRLGLQVDELLHAALSLPRYDRLACPGGPVALAGRLLAHWECRGVEEQLRFLVRTHGLRQVVLIAHEGCGYYRERLSLPPAMIEEEQRKDLAVAAACAERLGEGIGVLAYFARRVGDRVRFEPVALPGDSSGERA